MVKKKTRKLGLALGAGAARGLVHIGVLKTLHKHNIYPDYIAGTSMGSVIGAFYSAGQSPEEIQEIAKQTNWKNMIDFTIPKSGLLKGELIETQIRKMVRNKTFKQLNIPLGIVCYNFTKNEKVVFYKGDVAKAVRASISIPGIFTPTKIDGDEYIDGVVADPTPFDVVKEMGADIIIAVDLYNKVKKKKGPIVRRKNLMVEFRQKLIIDELLNIKNYIFPGRWPKFIEKVLKWIFDKLLYPAKVLKIMAGRKFPDITKVLYGSFNMLANNFARERIEHADIDIKLRPVFKNLDWFDLDKVDEFVSLGEKCMEKEISKLKKKLES